MYGPVFYALFWLLAGAAGLLLAVLLFILLGVAAGSLPGLGVGSVMLECPHCRAQTPSNQQECRHCGKSFRDEAPAVQPVIDTPRLKR